MFKHHCDSGCEEPHYDEHSDECICEVCHEYHRQDGMEKTDGLDCCTDEINWHIEDHEWCGKHRQPFADINNTWCAECERAEEYEKKCIDDAIENEVDHSIEVKHEEI